MRLLLINPRFPESFWSFRWAMQSVLPGRRSVNPPLGLATLAALCPPDWDVTIVDENVESLPLTPQADIVGVCGMGVQLPRQRELLAYYRSRGHYVVAGGSYASLCPEAYEALADCVVSGEAEYVWPRFCREFEAGRPGRLYRETGEVDLADSPLPRFDLLRLDRYQTVSLQFSRGCPFRCEFCDIIVMFGRRPRTKPLEQVGRELEALRERGVHDVFFVDDNLIGDKAAVRRLLAYLAAWQREHDHRFNFGTEVSLDLAGDPGLLRLFTEAGFGWVFIGIESPDEASLRETGKLQNTRQDLLAAVRTIHEHGLAVLAGFIVGFDHDTVGTFERQRAFIMRSGIQAAMIGLLQATPRTPLHARLAAEGRLRPDAAHADNSRLGTNVVPLGMSYEALVDGYRTLHERLFSDAGIAGRVRNKLRHLRRPARRRAYPATELAGLAWRFATRGLAPGGTGRLLRFVGSVPWHRPRLIPLAVEDWIVGLSMRDFVERRVSRAAAPADGRARSARSARRARRAQRCLARLERTLERYRRAGSLVLTRVEVDGALSDLCLRLRGALDRRFFARGARQLERLLRRSRTKVTLQVDHLSEAQVRSFQKLLRRLAHHGDRVRIVVRGMLRTRVPIDSSVFDLGLEA